VKINEPSPLLLKYTFATKSMLRKNSIEARFGGVRLPTTIEKTNESITNLSDLVAMKIDKGNAVNVSDFGVLQFPINTFGDCGIHQGFDLTHGRRLAKGGRGRREVVSSPPHELTIGHFGGYVKRFEISVAYEFICY
jgi:hypothetical protein